MAVLDPSTEDDLLLADADGRPVKITDRIPTIILSTYHWTRDRSAEELGAIAALSQPVDLDPLCRLVSLAAGQAHRLWQPQTDLEGVAWSRVTHSYERLEEARAFIREMRLRLTSVTFDAGSSNSNGR